MLVLFSPFFLTCNAFAAAEGEKNCSPGALSTVLVQMCEMEMNRMWLCIKF